ncbi:PfkB family carbohydrate kinase, partial [Streptomyces kanasensis]|uniref:PfkB family carbohydrate kinase n=1 Tax=Streptomyces kanasensis TaxID=936756 RepID=UPI000AC57B46
ANTAVALARLGTPARFLGRLSGDVFGTLFRERLAASGVDLTQCVTAPEPSTLAVADLDVHGRATYSFFAEGAADWQWTAAELAAVEPAGTVCVHTGSLALQLLGSRTHLVWYLPSLSDPSAAEGGGPGDGDRVEEEGDFLCLVPSGWLWGTLQLAVAAVLAAVWRARRLGPLVAERLPVAVRASEATEGRARLYFRADARDRAAAVASAFVSAPGSGFRTSS